MIRPILLVLSFLIPNCASANQAKQSSNQLPAQQVETATPDSLQRTIGQSRRTAITQAVKKAGPAVVSINVMGTRMVQDPWFDLFFGRRRSRQLQRKVQGVGSGFVISPDGYIVTNDHVVSIGNTGEAKINVAFPDGKTLKAKLIGTDPVTDIALLKVNPDEKLPHLTFGQSSKVLTGEWAIAMGNPFGLFEATEPTVTVGVVSAKDRDFEAQENRLYRDMIQTDAAINQGNSGGPLLNALGKVIGVNTFIVSAGQGAGSVGIGFAVPADKVHRIVEELRKHGKVDRSYYTGLSVRNLSPRIARALNLSSLDGALVGRIDQGSPADRAGFQPYDVVVAIGSEPVHDRQDAYLYLTEYRPGDKVPVTVVRKGKEKELMLKLTKRRN